MEEKLLGVHQGELYIFGGFGSEGKYPIVRTMRPLFQSEVDELNDPNVILDYVEELWRSMVDAGKTKSSLKEFAAAYEDESRLNGELFPGDITSWRNETENLIYALPEEQKNQLRECFDMDFGNDPEPAHTNKLTSWTLTNCHGSISAPNQDWDVLFDPELWVKIQDCKAKAGSRTES